MTTTKRAVNRPSGVVHSSEDGYVCAKLQQKKDRWELQRVRRYPSDTSIKQLPLLKNWILLGLPTLWQPSEHIDEETWTPASNATTDLKPTAHSAELGMHVSRLQYNLAGITTDDVFLSTIPLESAKVKTASFVSVYKSTEVYLVGIVLEKRLCAVFRFETDSVPISSQIGRVQRFWVQKTGNEFPQTICFLGEGDVSLGMDDFIILPVEKWGNNEDELRACGLALAQKNDEEIPTIHEQTISAGMLRLRNSAALFSIILVVLVGVSLLIPYGLATHYENKSTEYKNEYQRILRNNTEIRQSFNYNKKVAGRILTLQKLFTRQTAWSRLLSVLATSGPQGLFLEKLGSKNMKDSPATQLAFSGWAPSESAVTEFISTLSKEPYISDIQLSSIQRDKKIKTVTRFKVQCLLHEIKQ